MSLYAAFLSLFFQSGYCGFPPQVTNGNVYYRIFASVGSVARYYCDFGTNLVGNRTIVCQDDGTWEDPPMCVLPSEYMK